MSDYPQVVTTAVVRIVVDDTGEVERALTRGSAEEVHIADVNASSAQLVTYLFEAGRVDSVSLTNAFSGISLI